MMMLGVMWMMTAVVVGFMLGRASMYGHGSLTVSSPFSVY